MTLINSPTEFIPSLDNPKASCCLPRGRDNVVYTFIPFRDIRGVYSVRTQNPRSLIQLDPVFRPLFKFRNHSQISFRFYTDKNMVAVHLFHEGGKWSLF